MKSKCLLTILVVLFVASTISAQANHLTLVRFYDLATGRGIGLVEMEAFNAISYQSDNLGYVAIIEPELEGEDIRFEVRGHGYRLPHKDFFGQYAISIKIVPGTLTEIGLVRTMHAQRLYQITGSGRFHASILAGIDFSDNMRPAGKVVGIDSAVPVMWHGKLLSFYGDSLGPTTMNLSGSGALIDFRSPDVPEERLPVNFFTDETGFTARMFNRDAPGFIWVETVVPVKFADNSEVLAARYVVHETLENAVETGYAIFNERTMKFDTIRTISSNRHHKSARAVELYYNGRDGWGLLPWERVENRLTDFINPSRYEYFSCLEVAGDFSDHKNTIIIDGIRYRIRRDNKGKPILSWQSSVPPFSLKNQQKLVKSGLISDSETWLKLTEITTGNHIVDFTGSISFNEFRNRWIMIAQGATGEIWYSEADTYTGPWVYARKVVEHDDYNFYNPVHHRWFDAQNGKVIYFEGTYTSFFTQKERKTPRTDYNQVMFKLELDNENLMIPLAVYSLSESTTTEKLVTYDQLQQLDYDPQAVELKFFAFASDHGKAWLIPCEVEGLRHLFVIDSQVSHETVSKYFHLDLIKQFGDNKVLRPMTCLHSLSPEIKAGHLRE